MKKLLHFLLLLVCSQAIIGCMFQDRKAVIQAAETVLYEQPDSALKLLGQIEYPKALPHDQLMLYGWIQARAHRACGISMSEDSLILPAADYLIAQSDSTRLPDIYLTKAFYHRWTLEHDKMEAALDTAILIAHRNKDTTELSNLYFQKGEFASRFNGDHASGTHYMEKALRYRETPGLLFSIGISLALHTMEHPEASDGMDSASHYMDRAIERALAEKDTVQARHYMRNYAQMLTTCRRTRKAIALAKRTLPLMPDGRPKALLYSCIGENYLKEGNLDSAQHYVTLARRENPTFVTTRNMIAQYQMIIDYVRTRDFDNVTIGRYNDSIGNALNREKNTVRQKEQSKALLEKERLQAELERQHTRMVLLATLFLSVICGGAVAFYFRNRRHRLIETEERIEALTRLLADATRNEQEGVEDEHFFKKILLQQLGIIRMVAAQPTTQNQEMLRRISGISNREIPAESLLVWEDLYPLIDKIYNGFYSRIKQHYGETLNEKEQQLCCLLCAEFSTKEISVVTQQSIPTIYQRKTSIRKKLSMDEKEDIIEFINQRVDSIERI